jgi:hypothetical protein
MDRETVSVLVTIGLSTGLVVAMLVLYWFLRFDVAG